MYLIFNLIYRELHNLRFNKIYQTNGFVEVKNIRCIVGRYPYKLLELWDTYDEEKNSENDSPSMFTDDQIYIALELGNGGQDMEAFVFNNSAEAYITFLQVIIFIITIVTAIKIKDNELLFNFQAALALAVAEKSLDFEHRDMHWGNILISRTNEKQVSCRLGNEEISLQCNGIKVSIIYIFIHKIYQSITIVLFYKFRQQLSISRCQECRIKDAVCSMICLSTRRYLPLSVNISLIFTD